MLVTLYFVVALACESLFVRPLCLPRADRHLVWVS